MKQKEQNNKNKDPIGELLFYKLRRCSSSLLLVLHGEDAPAHLTIISSRDLLKIHCNKKEKI